MRFCFSDVVVDEKLISLTRNGQKQEVEPKIFELLVYFCRHPNVPISREELIEHVWDKRIVSNAAINRAVSELRKTIEADPAKPTIIKTVSKVGYQFSVTPTVENRTFEEPTVANSTAGNISEDTVNFVSAKDVSQSGEVVGIESQYSIEQPSKAQQKSGVTSWIFISGLIILLAIVALYFGRFTETETEQFSATNYAEQPLTSLKGASFKAQYANNGKDILFLHRESPNELANVWLQPESSKAYPLTNDGYYYIHAVFAGDNQVIASRFNNLQQRQCDIVRIDIATKKVKSIVDCAARAVTKLAYSETKNALFFNFRTEVNSPFSIYSYHLETKRFQQVTLPYSGGNLKGDYQVAISPDENRLAVLEYQSNSSSLLKIVDMRSEQTTYHKHEFGSFSSLAWTSDDELIVSDGKGLKRYSITSERIEPLTTNSDIGHVAANIHTGAIAFDKNDVVVNIFKLLLPKSLKPSPPQVLSLSDATTVTQSVFTNYSPVFANNSYKNTYVSTDKGEKALFFRTDDGQVHDLKFNGVIKSLGNTHWSPKDNRLAAIINNRLYIFDDAQGQWQQHLPGNNSIHYVQFLNDDEVLFSSDIDGDWQIWRLNLLDARLSKVTTTGGYSVQIGSKDNEIFLTKFTQKGIYRLDLSTGKEEVVLPDVEITSWSKWQVRDDALYLLDNGELSMLDISASKMKAVYRFEQLSPVSFSISHDQKFILFDTVESSSANIWQINAL